MDPRPLLLLMLVLVLAPWRSSRAEEAKDLWESKCKKCHGPGGKGNTQMGRKLRVPNFTRERWQKRHDDDEIRKAISEGHVEKGKRVMPAFKEKLTEEQIDELVLHVRSLGKAEQKAE